MAGRKRTIERRKNKHYNAVEVTNAPSFNGMKVRKRHVLFTDLSFKQLFDLDNYLRNNASDDHFP